MVDAVPVARALSDMYSPDALPAQAQRWDRLLSTFASVYGRPAEFVARSPGRVNIIGEHIDYSLYSVLPMAIAADALLAVAASDEDEGPEGTCKMRIANIQAASFPACEFDLHRDAAVDIDATVHEWSNYFKAGLRGALDLLRRKRGALFRPKSMRILMDGTVPAGGGLSSSAAFLSASALAALAAHGHTPVDKTDLAELAIASERAVGVNSGGMDQSASVFSQRGSALLVSFSPALAARPVSFPATDPELAFVVAQSFVHADKFVTGPVHYNLRVVECSLAAAYLNAVLNPAGTQLPADSAPLGLSLRGFHDTYLAAHPHDHNLTAQLEMLVDLTKTTLIREDGYSREDVAAAIGMSEAELDARFTSRFPVRAVRFRLRQRALHVFSEALRVLRFLQLLESEPRLDDSGQGTGSYNAKLGALLDEAQASCRDVYDCSCPEIDRICAIARRAGSLGSRLTGAGWGGCSVHLVPAGRVEDVKGAWEREYYSGLALTEEQREAAVVVSRPGSGCALYWVA